MAVNNVHRTIDHYNMCNMGKANRHGHSGKLILLPYSTYYKPMGDLSYISSEQGGGLIIHHGLIMRITIYKRQIPIYNNFDLKRGVGL